MALQLTKHPAYFSWLDIHPTAITSMLEQRAADAYDFAAHTTPSTTHRRYDRRKTKVAGYRINSEFGIFVPNFALWNEECARNALNYKGILG
ncbi:hypothetical protein MB84_31070 [Pandoraea oxalativorans]|uniref:Uncharacterized protein n=1 Tax=Pandoraea oxalativorans TaxID=573737 RepID=A0A192B1B0_9BURK|nr:hypothetical protein MB84_31070 [Pandoraea oxalativorans]